MARNSERYALAASAILLALALLMTAWEGWIAPIRPGGSWLLLKALPPLLLLPKIWRGDVYTFKWAPLVMLLYFTEGVVRAWSGGGFVAVSRKPRDRTCGCFHRLLLDVHQGATADAGLNGRSASSSFSWPASAAPTTRSA